MAGHTQFVEQGDEVGVGAVVEDQEAGVHRGGDAAQRDVHRVGMATQAFVALEQGDMVAARQQVGAGEAGNAAAHHGDTLAGGGCGAAGFSQWALLGRLGQCNCAGPGGRC